MVKQLIGFIGQGFIGKNYADDFEKRGFSVVRYALEEPYVQNKEKIRECEIVFVAVPTPTTPEGADTSIVEKVLSLVGPGRIAVIKSTVPPGTTQKLQEKFSDSVVLHSPEFLVESTAVYDAAHPTRNIIGITKEEHRDEARKVLAVLPQAPVTLVVSSTESELIKYAANGFLFTKVVYANLLYDVCTALGADWEHVRDGIAADPRIGPSHLKPIDVSRHPGATPGRGAGGHCFIKDFAVLRELYARLLPQDEFGKGVLSMLEEKNKELLAKSGKDLDLLEGVYGSA